MTWVRLFLSQLGLSPWLLLGGLLAALSLFGVGYWRGGHAARADFALDQVKADKIIAEGIAKANIITYNVSLGTEIKLESLRTFELSLIREVTRYVSPSADAHCVVPVGFRLLHDAAASGLPVPVSPGGSNDADSGLAISTVAATIADNYGRCNAALIKLEGWKDWAKQQALRP